MYYHSYPGLQQYFYNYHTYTYEAELRHMYPYTSITFSVNGYISLLGLRVDHFMLVSNMWHLLGKNSECHPSNEISMYYYYNVQSGDYSIIQLRRWLHRSRDQTSWHTKHVTSNEQDEHENSTDHSIQPKSGIKYAQSNLVHTPFLQVTRVWSPVQIATMDGVALPVNVAISWIGGEVRDDLPVGTVTTSCLSTEQSAPGSVCGYTHSSSILKEANMQNHYADTYAYKTRVTNGYRGGSVYEWSTIAARRSAWVNCTYRWNTLWSMHSCSRKLLHKPCAPTQKTPYDCRTLMMRFFHSMEAIL